MGKVSHFQGKSKDDTYREKRRSKDDGILSA
jgi:hypothetical protein